MTLFRFILLSLIALNLSFFTPSSTLHAQEEDDPILVQLETETPLAPLYLMPMNNAGTDFTDVYLRQIENILAFDLHHNGSNYLVKRSPALNQIAPGGDLNYFGSLQEWKGKNIQYVVKTQIQGRNLEAIALDVQNQSLKNMAPVPLTGDLNQDRRQIHRLADTLYKALFNAEGIASTRILYTLRMTNSPNSQKWTSEVWEADYDGGNARQLTKENAYCVTPTYLPPKPGNLTGGFLYVSYQLGQPKIYAASLKEGVGHRLMFLKGNQLMPALSQQRDKVAFISDVTGNPDLFIQPFNPEVGALGKPYQVFSAKQATQGSPTFSPDGKRVAFVSDKDGSPKIYVIQIPPPGTSLNKIKATQITKRNRENSAPAWSPDGKKLAYCARGKGERQIWVYDFETNQERQLTQGPGNKENPSWAPNSLHLVFNSSDANASELYLIHLNQQEATQITGGRGEKRFPNWEPRPK